MADNVPITAGAGTSIATDDVGGVHYQINKLAYGALDSATLVSTANGLPVQVSGSVAVTGAFYQATQPVSLASTTITGSVAVTGPLTDTQLRTTAVPVSLASTTITGTVTTSVSGSVAVTGTFWQATQPVSGTFWQATQPVSIASMPSTPVTGTFWQATQPVSGPLTDTQLRATPVPVSGTFTPAATPESTATFRGRASTFRTPGRAGTTGQKIFALHNATGSTKVVHINQLVVDLYQTVVKAVTVAPPIIRIHKFTAVPTNGTALTKVSKDSALTTNASITAWGDASADGTGSATTLTVTIPANSVLTQEYAPRLITAAGYEMFDRTELLEGKDIVLRALEGVVVFLDYVLATQNPITDMWIVGCDWWEV